MDLVLFIICLLLSVFFSSSETAFLSLNKIKIKQIESSDRASARKVARLLRDPNVLIVTILIGNNLVNMAASSLMAGNLYSYFGEKGIAVSIALMTMVLLIFGEVTPKMFALANGEKVSQFVSNFMFFFKWLFTPIRKILITAAYAIVRSLGLTIYPESYRITEDEIRSLFSIGKKAGIVKKKEKDMIDNILEFKEINVADIMSPRIDIVALNLNAGKDHIIRKIKDHQYSRFPVYVHSLDNIVGILHAKDFLLKQGAEIKDMVRKPLFVPESMKVDDLLRQMQGKHMHMTIVTDEYGVTSGVVTIEDVLESIVGEIRDELDYEMPKIVKQGQNEFIVNGQAHIDEVNEATGINIETTEVDTIGGFFMLKIGRIPEKGDNIEMNGFKLTVDDVSKNRITSLTLERIQ